MATHRGTVVKVSSKGANQQQFKNVIRFTKSTLEDGTTLALRVQLPVNRVYELPVADE